jgi:hypothetical protein
MFFKSFMRLGYGWYSVATPQFAVDTDFPVGITRGPGCPGVDSERIGADRLLWGDGLPENSYYWIRGTEHE